MKQAPNTLQVPFQNQVIDDRGLVDNSWSDFFGNVQTALDPLGVEKYFKIVDNQSSPADVEGLSFQSNKVGQVIVDYLIQRVTDSVELIESGTFHLVFRPLVNDWDIVYMGTPGPDDADVTFTITAAGQVQYTSSNIAGAESISKMSFRYRTMAAKNHQYSVVGR